jgi:hypothetical protein
MKKLGIEPNAVSEHGEANSDSSDTSDSSHPFTSFLGANSAK